MCFYVHPDHPKVKIATKDIRCYKILTPCHPKHVYRSEIVNAKYDFKKRKIFQAKNKRGNVIKHLTTKGGGFVSERIHEGIHSYSKKRGLLRSYISCSYEAVEFVIPKGAEYYYNPECKEYVSTKVRFVRVLRKGRDF